MLGNKIYDSANVSTTATVEGATGQGSLSSAPLGKTSGGEVAAKVQVVNASEITVGGVTVANGADVAQGSTTDAPVVDNTTVASATAATGVALWKRLVNLGIAILAKLPGAVTPHVTLLGASSEQIIPSGAKGWSYVILTGTATVGGVALVPAGVGDSDPNVLAASLTITTASASSAYVRWNT